MSEEVRYKKSISIRTDEKMDTMLQALGDKLLLNTTSIMRLALVNLYEQQIGEKPINNGDA